MLIINRIIPWFVGLVTLLGLLVFLGNPGALYYGFPLMALLLGISIWYLTGQRLSNLDFWNFTITPILLLTGGVACLLVLEEPLLRNLLAVLIAAMELLLFFILSSFLHRPESYEPYALGNILTYLNLVALFFLFVGIFSLSLFFNPPFWLMLILAAVVSLLLAYEMKRVQHTPLERSRWFILVDTIIMVELFTLLWFWPTSYFVKALTLTVVYYVTNGIASFFLLQRSDRQTLRRYLVFTGVVLVVVLITSRWT